MNSDLKMKVNPKVIIYKPNDSVFIFKYDEWTEDDYKASCFRHI